ncbi:MAG: methionyl-tRNA formyltransferase [Rickettsiales bacterium]|nr:methionyl-tRNA formyltransferase [Rickettsiales bacterium]
MSKINVAFFGSSTFSLETLGLLLHDKDINLKAIITMPPAEKNRGKKLQDNIVKEFALKNSYSAEKIFEPKTLRKNQELLEILVKMELDFIVVVAYGKIITKEIIDLPKYEILNLHPSSLPKYRGAAPLERAIEAGEEEIDICIMRVDVGLDTGDVAVRKKYIIKDKHASEIIPEVSKIGSQMMVDVIKKVVNSGIKFEPQTEEGMIYANKIEKSELLLDFTLPASTIYNKIRAFNLCGGYYFMFEEQRVKILQAELLQSKINHDLGFDKNDGKIYLKDGVIVPKVLQKEGKKPIPLKDFLNGIKH